MKKALSLVAASLLGASLFVGCNNDGASSDGTEAPTPERKFLSVGTAPTGGAFFVVGGALAEVAGKFGADLGWQVTAEATQGSQENIRRLVAGELDFALANAAITYFGVRGEAGWDKAYDVQAVMTLAPNIALFVTPSASDVETLQDLKGKRVSVGPAGAGFEMFVGPLLEAHGVSFDDFEPLNATQSGAVDLLSDGSAAAAFLGGAVPTASIIQAATSMPLHFIPFGEAEKEQLMADYPFFAPATIPAGTYRGQDEDYAGLNVGSMQLITGAQVDEETVYQFTKLIYEQRAEVVARHPAGKAIQPKVVVRNTGTPFHPGAIRFYKEIGIWPDDTVPAAGSSDDGSSDDGSSEDGASEDGASEADDSTSAEG